MQIVNPYRDKLLAFGVPLEDVFPVNDVHPAIKNLFDAAEKSVSESGYSVQLIISRFQGCLEERFILKDQLLYLGYFTGEEVPPGAYLWLIRHFLGLLPQPLLRTRTPNKRIPWKVLYKICSGLLDKPCTTACLAHSYVMARYLREYPKQERMLFVMLMNLLSNLVNCKNFGGVKCLVKYFTPALFARPYLPSRKQGLINPHCCLMFFILTHWDLIGSHFEKDQIEKTNARRSVQVGVLKSQTHKSTQTNDTHRHSFAANKGINSTCSYITATQEEHPSGLLSCEDEYFYDEDYKDQENTSSLLEKVSKVGWTYTPPSPTPNPPQIGWNVDSEQYNLCFDDSEVKSIEDIDVGEEAQERASQKCVIQSKFRFLKKLMPTFSGLKIPSSNEDATCKIKYKRIKRSRSMSF